MSGQPQARHFLTTLDLAQTQLYHFTTIVSGVTIVGTITGQLYFDWLGDKMAENSLWNDLR
jgi:hypothetical protein